MGVATRRVGLVPGDEPGPGLCEAARAVIEAIDGVEAVEVDESAVADASIDCDAVVAPRPLPGLARKLGHPVHILAVQPTPFLAQLSPLRKKRLATTDLVLVRATAEAAVEPSRIGRVAAVALGAAEARRGWLTATAAATGRAGFRGAVARGADRHRDVEIEHLDPCQVARLLVTEPRRFDVIAGDQAAGSVLEAEAAAITGVPTLLPAARLGADAPPIFTPLHGPESPEAARGFRNPLGVIRAVGLMLRHAFDRHDDAERVEVAAETALEAGLRTPDVFTGDAGERRIGLAGMASAVAEELSPVGASWATESLGAG